MSTTTRVQLQLKFFRMNSIGTLLTLTTVAAIVICHPIAPIANTALEIALFHIPTAVQFYTPLGSGSLMGIEPDNIDILHLGGERNVLVSQGKEPLPPRPDLPGGSR